MRLEALARCEARVLVVYIGPGPDERDRFDERARALFYVALTRLKIHAPGIYLTVVSAVQDLADFGRPWSESESSVAITAEDNLPF